MIRRLESIQALRGIAAILVVGFHAAYTLNARGWTHGLNGFLLEWPRMGVDIFFVVSGAIMVITTFDQPAGKDAVTSFLKARLARIAPLYWLLTTVMLVLSIAANGRNYHPDVRLFLSSYLFFPPAIDETGHQFPILSTGWTLVYEMWFYVLFALSLFLPRQWRVPAVSALLAGSVLAGYAMHLNGAVTGVYTSPLLLEFLYGCGIGLAYRHGVQIGKGWAALMLAIGVVCLSLSIGHDSGIDDINRFVYWGIPAALVLTGAIYLERNGAWAPSRSLRALGNVSYSLYLSHAIVQLLLAAVLTKLDRNHHLSSDMLWVVFVAVSTAAGFACYRLIEVPLERLARARLHVLQRHAAQPVSQHVQAASNDQAVREAA
jgi:exopolysaccharide production protein ExoZ